MMKGIVRGGLVLLFVILSILGIAYYNTNYKEQSIKVVLAQQNLSIPWTENWSSLRLIYEIPKDAIQNPNGLTLDVEIPELVIDWLKAYIDANNITKDLEETLIPQVYYYTDYDNSQNMVRFGIYHYIKYKNVSIPYKILVSDINLKGEGGAWKNYNHYIIVYFPLLWVENFEKYPVGSSSLGTWRVYNPSQCEVFYLNNDKAIRSFGDIYKLLHLPVSPNWTVLYLLAKLGGPPDTGFSSVRITVWFKTKQNKIVGVSFLYVGDTEVKHSNFNMLGTICYTKKIYDLVGFYKENLLYYLATYCGISIHDIDEIYGISITGIRYEKFGIWYDAYVSYIGLTVEQK